MGPNPNGPRSVSCDRAIRDSGLEIRSVGPVGDFLKKGTATNNGSLVVAEMILYFQLMIDFHLLIPYRNV